MSNGVGEFRYAFYISYFSFVRLLSRKRLLRVIFLGSRIRLADSETLELNAYLIPSPKDVYAGIEGNTLLGVEPVNTQVISHISISPLP